MAEENKAVFGLAFNIKQPTADIIDTLEKDFGAREVESGMYAFPYDAEHSDNYDEAGEWLGSMFVGVMNTADNKFYKRPDLTSLMAEDTGQDENEADGTIPLSSIADVDGFIVDHQKQIADAINEVRDEHYPDAGIPDTTGLTVRWADDDHDTTITHGGATNPEAASEKPAKNTEGSSEEATAEASADIDLDSMFGNDDQATTGQTTDASVEPSNEQPAEDGLVATDEVVEAPEARAARLQTRPDLAMSLAADIFIKSEPLTLPKYDDATQKQILSDYVKGSTTVGNAADQAIYSMADLIRNHRKEFEADFAKQYQQYTDLHEEALKDNAASADEKTDAAKHTAEEKYDQDKNAYVEANRGRLEAEYDQKNQATFKANLKATLDQITSDRDRRADEENVKYDQARHKAEAEYVERRIRNMDFDTIFNDYEATLKDVTNGLADKASSFAGQVAVVTEKLVKDRDNEKERNDILSNENEFLKRTMAERIDAEAAKQVVEKTSDLQGKLADASEKATQMQETIDSLTEKNDNLTRDNASLKRTQEDLLNTQAANQANKAAEPQVVTVKQETPAEPKKDKRGNGWLGFVAGLLIAGGIGTGYLALNPQYNQAKKAAEPQVIQVQPAASSSSSSQHQYKKGDTFAYHSDKDNKNYTVTMDSATNGHYTDAGGNYHQVTLKN